MATLSGIGVGGLAGRNARANCGQGGQNTASPLASQKLGCGLRRHPIFAPTAFRGAYIIAGVTLDSGGAPLAGCMVMLYTESDVLVAQTVSDGSGAYSFAVGFNGNYYLVATAPTGDAAGATPPTVIPTPV